MAHNRRLATDQDFKEAMERQTAVRVFQDDLVVNSGGIIIRFNEDTIIIQAGVSDIAHHPRHACEFFEMRRR